MGQKCRQGIEVATVSERFSMSSKRRRHESCASQQCTVKVIDVPAGTSEDLLLYYFENTRRSNGGPVSGIDMKPDLHMCLVTFEHPEGMFKLISLTVLKSNNAPPRSYKEKGLIEPLFPSNHYTIISLPGACSTRKI